MTLCPPTTTTTQVACRCLLLLEPLRLLRLHHRCVVPEAEAVRTTARQLLGWGGDG